MSKKLTLNAEKRKAIADVFQQHFEENSKAKEKHQDAIVNYNLIREKAKTEMEKVVRYHQPQEDVDTIRSMINKYGERNGGQLHEDNCFYVSMPITKVDDEGREYDATDEVHIKFDMEREFAYSYYRDELKSKGYNADYKLTIEGDYSKRNPKYYADESSVDEYLGYSHKRNDVSGNASYLKDQWENDFKLWTIGSSYCHSRQFKVDENTLNFFKMYRSAQDEVVKTHEHYTYVENKMKKLRLGLKSYKYFDQAKKLADNLNVPLNESILNESSSMALSIYSPDNLASLLEDKVELTRDEKIAIARQQMQQQQSYN